MALADIISKIIYFMYQGQYIAPIHPIKVSNTRSKKLRKRTPTQSSQNWENGPKDTKIKDKLQIENVYEIDGWIEPIETGDTDITCFPDEKTAQEVKNEFLEYIFNNNSNPSNFIMYYEGEGITGTVEKVDITEEPMDKTTNASPRYSIKFIFVSKVNTIS